MNKENCALKLVDEIILYYDALSKKHQITFYHISLFTNVFRLLLHHYQGVMQEYKQYRGADKSLAWPTSRYILFDGKNISFDASLVIYINSTNIPPIMIINRIYEHQNLLSL